MECIGVYVVLFLNTFKSFLLVIVCLPLGDCVLISIGVWVISKFSKNQVGSSLALCVGHCYDFGCAGVHAFRLDKLTNVTMCIFVYLIHLCVTYIG